MIKPSAPGVSRLPGGGGASRECILMCDLAAEMGARAPDLPQVWSPESFQCSRVCFPCLFSMVLMLTTQNAHFFARFQTTVSLPAKML